MRYVKSDFINQKFKSDKDFWSQWILNNEYESKGFKVLNIQVKFRLVFVLYHDAIRNLVTIDAIKIKHNKINGWSYTIYNEELDPFYYECGKALLRQSNNMAETAVKWREKCVMTKDEELATYHLREFAIYRLEHGRILNTRKHGKVKFLELLPSGKNLKVLRLNDKQIIEISGNAISTDELNK